MPGTSLRPEHLALKELVVGAFRDAVQASLGTRAVKVQLTCPTDQVQERVIVEAAAHAAAAVLADAHRRCGPGADAEGASSVLPCVSQAVSQPSGNTPKHALCSQPAAATPSAHSLSKSSGPASTHSTAPAERSRMATMEDDAAAVAAALAASAKPSGVQPRGLILPGLVVVLLGVLLVGLVLPVYLGAERNREQEAGQVRGHGTVTHVAAEPSFGSRCVAQQRFRPTAAHASTPPPACMHASGLHLAWPLPPACAALHGARSYAAWRACAAQVQLHAAFALPRPESCMHVCTCLHAGRRIITARCTTRRRRCSQHRSRCRQRRRRARQCHQVIRH